MTQEPNKHHVRLVQLPGAGKPTPPAPNGTGGKKHGDLSLSLASSERGPGPCLEAQQEVTRMKDKNIRMQASPRAEHASETFHMDPVFTMQPSGL